MVQWFWSRKQPLHALMPVAPTITDLAEALLRFLHFIHGCGMAMKWTTRAKKALQGQQQQELQARVQIKLEWYQRRGSPSRRVNSFGNRIACLACKAHLKSIHMIAVMTIKELLTMHSHTE